MGPSFEVSSATGCGIGADELCACFSFSSVVRVFE